MSSLYRVRSLHIGANIEPTERSWSVVRHRSPASISSRSFYNYSALAEEEQRRAGQWLASLFAKEEAAALHLALEEQMKVPSAIEAIDFPTFWLTARVKGPIIKQVNQTCKEELGLPFSVTFEERHVGHLLEALAETLRTYHPGQGEDSRALWRMYVELCQKGWQVPVTESADEVLSRIASLEAEHRLAVEQSKNFEILVRGLLAYNFPPEQITRIMQGRVVLLEVNQSDPPIEPQSDEFEFDEEPF